MAWEQDYHLQDPGRLALFDEYLEMGMWKLRKITMFKASDTFRRLSSFAIRIRYIIRCCIPIGATLCSAQQYRRNSIGCIQNGNTGSTTVSWTSGGHWSMVWNTSHHYLCGCCVECFCHCIYQRLHTKVSTCFVFHFSFYWKNFLFFSFPTEWSTSMSIHRIIRWSVTLIIRCRSSIHRITSRNGVQRLVKRIQKRVNIVDTGEIELIRRFLRREVLIQFDWFEGILQLNRIPMDSVHIIGMCLLLDLHLWSFLR